jgi:hypothetical protein
MSEPTNKSLWPWILVLSVGLPILYVASFGPWMFFSTHVLYDYPSSVHGWGFYAPLYSWVASDVGPECLAHPYNAYLNWWLFQGM